MIQEDKQLLLKDLCARLPYRIAIKDDYGDTIFLDYNDVHIQNYFEGIVDGVVRPYLRPMSSMTEEERQGYNEYLFHGASIGLMSNTATAYELINWLLEHHFDFMGLIEKGLAIEVNNKNNPYKE